MPLELKSFIIENYQSVANGSSILPRDFVTINNFHMKFVSEVFASIVS
jgi:hypothetical protein